ncbi:MAG: OmpA family protein [Endomicrobium sp.]|jgi:outer membrane protein OmpA-like peptidoglycan-associated protein|nr:OmpA family protein [Endomicrobium sp.]
MKRKYKIFLVLLSSLFFSACCSKLQNHGDYLDGAYIHEKNKDMLSSKEILVTSLFVATSHIPEEIRTDIEFFEHGKSFLSKEARNKIDHFAAKILTYEDYSITIEGHEDISEAGYEENCNKISIQRAENVRSALIRNGIDKDKIEVTSIGISSHHSKEKMEESKQQNRVVIIEAEFW